GCAAGVPPRPPAALPVAARNRPRPGRRPAAGCPGPPQRSRRGSGAAPDTLGHRFSHAPGPRRRKGQGGGARAGLVPARMRGGLRALQSDLSNLVGEVVRARDALPRRVPVLVKLSPDEPDDRLAEMAKAAQAAGADGIIATNTTVDRGPVVDHPGAVEQGGLSG